MRDEWLEVGASGEEAYDGLLNQHFKESDIYFSSGYSKLFLKDDGRLNAYFIQEKEKSFLLPMIVRPIPGTDCFDFETAYGYSGYLSNTDDAEFIENAFEKLTKQCGEKKIIAGLFRSNPYLKNYIEKTTSASRLKFFKERDIVSLPIRNRALNQILEEEFSPAARTHLRKSEKSGITVHADDSIDGVLGFFKLYEATMSRVGAHESYFFGKDFFQKLKSNLADRFTVLLAKDGDEVIGGILLLFGGKVLNIFLSASTEKGLKLSVPSLLRSEATRLACDKGFECVNHGGGRTSDPSDSLLSFKKGFSTQTLPYFMGKMVSDSIAYNELCADWTASASAETQKQYGNYLLKYRY